MIISLIPNMLNYLFLWPWLEILVYSVFILPFFFVFSRGHFFVCDVLGTFFFVLLLSFLIHTFLRDLWWTGIPFLNFFRFVEVYLSYPVMLISAVQQNNSVIHIYILFLILSHYGLLQDIEYSHLGSTAGHYLLSNLHVIVCISNPKLPICPFSTPYSSLATTGVFSVSEFEWVFSFFKLYGCTCGIWNFPGQELNLSHSCSNAGFFDCTRPWIKPAALQWPEPLQSGS